MYYKIGFPFWKLFARMGAHLKIRVDVRKDEEAKVYVATSSDLRGSVCEAATMDDLVAEVNSTIQELLEFHMLSYTKPPVTDLRLPAPDPRFCAA